MKVYRFYCRVPHGEDSWIGALPERRKKAERISHQSIMNWARVHMPKYVLGDEETVYFVQGDVQQKLRDSSIDFECIVTQTGYCVDEH